MSRLHDPRRLEHTNDGSVGGMESCWNLGRPEQAETSCPLPAGRVPHFDRSGRCRGIRGGAGFVPKQACRSGRAGLLQRREEAAACRRRRDRCFSSVPIISSTVGPAPAHVGRCERVGGADAGGGDETGGCRALRQRCTRRATRSQAGARSSERATARHDDASVVSRRWWQRRRGCCISVVGVARRPSRRPRQFPPEAGITGGLVGDAMRRLAMGPGRGISRNRLSRGTARGQLGRGHPKGRWLNAMSRHIHPQRSHARVRRHPKTPTYA
jgi:hypothetical protein